MDVVSPRRRAKGTRDFYHNGRSMTSTGVAPMRSARHVSERGTLVLHQERRIGRRLSRSSRRWKRFRYSFVPLWSSATARVRCAASSESGQMSNFSWSCESVPPQHRGTMQEPESPEKGQRLPVQRSRRVKSEAVSSTFTHPTGGQSSNRPREGRGRPSEQPLGVTVCSELLQQQGITIEPLPEPGQTARPHCAKHEIQR